MNYSLFEQHNDGSWWYHRHTFTNRSDAEDYMAKWIWWDKTRPKTIYEHKKPFPQETLWTRDFKDFCRIGDPTPIEL